jgi:WD40 repeat protein
MTADELARAIDLPARAAGLRVEPELTRALVDDVRDEPGALPLLSTTLLDLWLRRDGRTMRLAAYERLGGVSASVARLAESAIEGLARDQVQLARGILLRLATRPEDGPAVRRPVALASLDVHRDPAVAAVLDQLIEHRLVTVDQGSVEIAHEVLLHAWPRLRTWLQEDAEGGRLRARLARATADWVAGGEDPAELYRGARLTATLEWAADRDAELNETERRFLAEGRLAGEREVERQRRANNRLRRLLAGVVLLLVMALGAGVFAATQLVRAEHQSELAQARALAASAVAALDTDPGLAKLLALSAAEVDPSIETLAVLHQAFAADAVIDRYQWPADRTGGQLWTDIDPDGRRIAAAGTYYGPSDHLELVDLMTDEVLWMYPGTASTVAVGPAFFSRDGRTVVGGVASGAGETRPDADAVGAFVWDAQTGEELRHLSLGPCGGYVTDISDTHLLAVVRSRDLDAQPCASLDPRAEAALVLVELASGRMTTVTERVLTDDLDGPGALSGDGRLVAFDDQAGASPGLVVAEVETGRRILELPEAQAPGFVRGLSEDGSLLLVGDRPLLVLDVSDGNGPPRAAFAGHEGASYFADFASSGTTVYSTGRDATLRIWDGATGEEHSSFRAVGGGRAAASRDGTVVLVADPESAAAAVVDTRPKAEVAVVDTCRAVFVSATTLHVADGLAVFQETCDDDPEYNGVTQVIDLATRELRYSLAGWEGQALAVSPDGRLFLRQEYRAPMVGPLAIRELATGDLVRELDGLCRWDFNRARLEGRVATGECEPFPTSPFPIHVLSARWSPDGAMIVATDHHDADGFVAVWRATDGALLYRSPAGGVRAFDAIFTPDSRHLVVSFFGTGRLEAIRTDTWEPVASADPASAADAGDGRLGLVGFTPDASSLVAVGGYLGTGGGSLHWLDPATLRPRRTPVTEAHDGSPKSAGLDPTGQWLATGASDGVVRVWDAATGALVHEARLTGTEVQGVAFSGAWELVILPTSGHLLVDTMHPVRLIEAVRASITRGLTTQECARYGIAPCPTLETLRGG